jgi:DNA (cytosine-5)-methyltransferase 1
MTRTYRLMDLFAGCGGMTRGFVDTGRFDPVFAVEFDPDAAETYELNFGRHIARSPHDPERPAAIEDVEEFPDVDVVIGGPPCQGFSPLNMRGAGLERRGLWFHYVRAIEQARPLAFVMENVPQLLRSAEYADFKEAVEELGLGYEIDEAVLNAADYGVPQTRRRAIVIGTRAGTPKLPDPTHCDPRRSELGRDPWRDFRWAVSGLPLEPTGRDWHNPRNPKPISLERYRAIPNEGENRFDLAARRPDITPRCWLDKETGSTDVFGRLWWDRPAYTIRTEFFKPEKGRYLHPSEHRPITLREAARCMSIPDDFRLPGPDRQSMTSVARQIGNAVPPLMAQRIADTLLESLGFAAPPAAELIAA